MNELDDSNGRRLKVLKVSSEALVNLFRLDGTRRIRIEGMPEDAQIIGVSDQAYFDRGLVAFKVHSQTFPAVLPGNMMPAMDLTVTEVRETDDCYLVEKTP